MKPATAVAIFLAGLICGVLGTGKTQDWAVATIGSQHLNGEQYCEFNPGAGVELSTNDIEVRTLVGAYRNSLCGRWSVYAGKSYLPLFTGKWRAGGAAMLITGYESALTLGAGFVLSYEGEKYGANIVWFPNKSGDFTDGVIALQAKVRW